MDQKCIVKGFQIVSTVRGKVNDKLLVNCIFCGRGATVHCFKKGTVKYYPSCRLCNVRRRKLEIVFERSSTIIEAEFIKAQTAQLTDIRIKCIHDKVITRRFKPMFLRSIKDGRIINTFDCTCDPSVQIKRSEATALLRYGQRNGMQVPEIFAKQRASAFAQKQFTWPSGKITTYQGYENWLYNILLQTNTESDIKTKTMSIAHFEYVVDDGSTHIYYPDAQIGNIIYEAKSWHTFGEEIIKTDLKMRAVLRDGYQTELWIFESPTIYFRRVWYTDGRKILYHPNQFFTPEAIAAAPKINPI